MSKANLHATVNCILIRSNKTCINNIVGECCQNTESDTAVSCNFSIICISKRTAVRVLHSYRPSGYGKRKGT
jgi:hypothetical protein